MEATMESAVGGSAKEETSDHSGLASPDPHSYFMEMVNVAGKRYSNIDDAVLYLRNSLANVPDIMEAIRDSLIDTALREYVHRYRGSDTKERKAEASAASSPKTPASSLDAVNKAAAACILDRTFRNSRLRDLRFNELPPIAEEYRNRAKGLAIDAKFVSLIFECGKNCPDLRVGDKVSKGKAESLWRKALTGAE